MAIHCGHHSVKGTIVLGRLPIDYASLVGAIIDPEFVLSGPGMVSLRGAGDSVLAVSDSGSSKIGLYITWE